MPIEDERERAFAHAGLAPRDQRAHHGDRADEEQHQTPQRGVDGLQHGGFRVARLAGGHADELGAGEREVDGQNRGEHRHEPIGEDTVLDEVAEHRSMLVAGDWNNAEDGEQADDDERADGEHLDRGEPEFRFGEEPHRQSVQGEDENDARRAPHPCGAIREPTLHEQSGGGEFGAERHRPGEPILDRDHEAGAGRGR